MQHVLCMHCLKKAPLFAWVQRKIIHSCVILGPDIIQTAIVPKSTPLHVHTHPAFISIYRLNVPHFFHVACIAACSCNDECKEHEEMFNVLTISP